MLGFGLGLTNCGIVGGVADAPDLGSGAAALLAGETDGLALDFTDQSARIKDTPTPSNNYNSTGIASNGSLVGPSGKLTYTSPSNKLTRQADGYHKYQAHNLFTSSELIGATGSTGWTAQRVTITAGQSDPFGGSTAVSFVEDSTASNTHRTFAAVTQAAGADVVISCYAKNLSGTRNLYIRNDAGGTTKYCFFNLVAGTLFDGSGVTGTITDAGNGWYYCEARFANATAVASQMFGLCTGLTGGSATYSGDGTSGVYIARAHMYRYPANTDYIKTTTAAKYALPLEYDTSGTCLGMPVEEARTNLCLYSNDLTQAGSWTASNMTTAKTATGPDNVANSATTITASAGNATILQAITSASAARVTSVYIKRRTGTGNIDLTQDNGSTWTTQAVDSTWTRFSLSSVTSANPTVGIRIVTSGDAVDVALFQHEVGAFVTSPIITYGSTATRAVDKISMATSAFPYSATAGTMYYQGAFVGVSTASTLRPWTLCDGTTSEVIAGGYVSSAPSFIVNDGGVSQVSISVGSISDSVAYKHAAAWEANNFNASKDGVVGTLDTSGTLPTVTTLYIGSREAGASHANGHIKAISYVPRRKSDAELQTETT